MPVYMNSGKIVADGRTDGRVDGWTLKVLQEVLADLKKSFCFIHSALLDNLLNLITANKTHGKVQISYSWSVVDPSGCF